MAFVNNVLPTNRVEPFSTNNVLALVFLSVLFGAAIRSFKHEEATWVPAVEQLVEGGCRVSERLMIWLVKLTPLAVFGVIAKVVGDSGFSLFAPLVKYTLTALLGLSIQMLIVYQAWLHFYCKRSLKEFWQTASESLFNAFGVNSSLASLPLTLKALDKLGCGKESSRMAACIGTNLNNDGILLYEAMAVIFASQTMGVHLTLGAQLTVAFLCVVTAVGIAGVPDAGLISLAVVLSTLGIPNEILPVLLVVDWIIARVRSITNVSADMTTALILDRMEKGKPPPV
jgi:DAACS family dicarboxylate/amino acid:cation (Na+ or H+) symporter